MTRDSVRALFVDVGWIRDADVTGVVVFSRGLSGGSGVKSIVM
jgi:hypothetical protein